MEKKYFFFSQLRKTLFLLLILYIYHYLFSSYLPTGGFSVSLGNCSREEMWKSGRLRTEWTILDPRSGPRSWCCWRKLSYAILSVYEPLIMSSRHKIPLFYLPWGVLLWHRAWRQHSKVQPMREQDLDQWECSTLAWKTFSWVTITYPEHWE